MTHLSIDSVRRERRAQKDDVDEVNEAHLAEAGEGILSTALGNDPRENLLRRELAGKIHEALATLPEKHRTILVLREVEGLSLRGARRAARHPQGHGDEPALPRAEEDAGGAARGTRGAGPGAAAGSPAGRNGARPQGAQSKEELREEANHEGLHPLRPDDRRPPGELAADERESLDVHLAACAACRAPRRTSPRSTGSSREALLARANARDFSTFADEVMARVGHETAARRALGAASSGGSSRTRAQRPRPSCPFWRRPRSSCTFGSDGGSGEIALLEARDRG